MTATKTSLPQIASKTRAWWSSRPRHAGAASQGWAQKGSSGQLSLSEQVELRRAAGCCQRG